MTTSTPNADISNAPASTEAGSERSLCLGRQPILDRNSSIFGYELLFRSRTDQNFFSNIDGNLATCQTMNNSLNVMGLAALVGTHKAFINMTRDLLVRDMYMALPPDRTVIELLEEINATHDVVQACKRLKGAGYLLALDDFVMKEGNEPLVEMADFIKVDFLALTKQQRVEVTDQLASGSTCLLAEKIETHADFEESMQLGYSFFQGYFFAKPSIHSCKPMPAFKQNYLRFLSEVSKPQQDLSKLESIIKEEPSLSIKLLHYLNSAAVGMRAKVSSIRQAVALLGERPLRQWAALVALTSLGEDKPSELLTMSLVRARFCELLSGFIGCGDRQTDLFLLGLLSTLDALLDRPLSEVLADIPVAPDVKAALMGSRTLLATVFGLAIACERGNTTLASMMARTLGLSNGQVSQVQQEAMIWADRVLQSR